MPAMTKAHWLRVRDRVTLAVMRAEWTSVSLGRCSVPSCRAMAAEDESPLLHPCCVDHGEERDSRTTKALVRSLDYWWRSRGIIEGGSKADRRFKDTEPARARAAGGRR